MPHRNRTGPEGKGPRTGRGRGDCRRANASAGNPPAALRRRHGSRLWEDHVPAGGELDAPQRKAEEN